MMSLLTELDNSWEWFSTRISPLTGLQNAGFKTVKANVIFCDGRVESPTLPFLFADTSDAALACWKTFQSGTNHLPHREKLSA